MLVKQLQDIGLTEKEAKIYNALLETGEATPQQLAFKTGVNRATTYVILESLVKRGLINCLNKNKKACFIIESPAQLVDILEKDKKKIEEKISLANSLMSELNLLKRLTKERTKVSFFEGREGVILIQKDVAKANVTKVDEMFNINIALKHFPVAENDHRQIIRRQKIISRTIIIYDHRLPIPDLPVCAGTERRYLPYSQYPLNGELVFYKNKAVMLSWEDNFRGIIIENKAIVDGLRLLFDFAWLGSAQYKIILEAPKK